MTINGQAVLILKIFPALHPQCGPVYRVQFTNGMTCLRNHKTIDPPLPSSWPAVESITGWNPMKEGA